MLKREIYTTAQVAKHYGVSPRTIRDWISTGCPTPNGPIKLQAAKYGRSWKFTEEDLLLFEHRVRPRQGRLDLDAEDPDE